MDNQQQSISDDQELAKALAGVNQGNDDGSAVSQPEQDSTVPAFDPMQPVDSTIEVTIPELTLPIVQPNSDTDLDPAAGMAQPMMAADSSLDNIKQDALNQLRPLVDKLDVSPEEKFDTYLLLIRSTDDRSLIGPANEVAKQITDETKKAQALLDIIKEIDFLSSPKQ